MAMTSRGAPVLRALDTHMDRQQLLTYIDEIEFFPEKRKEIFSRLEGYIRVKDAEMIEKLLAAGACPKAKDRSSNYLYGLLHEFEVERSTNGDKILNIMENLLQHGADPNSLWCNNWRAYDYAAAAGIQEVVELLLKYGATPSIREKI